MILAGRTPTKGERWLLGLWIFALAWTALAFADPGLTSSVTYILILLIVTFPLGMLLLFLPTVALYLTIGAPIYIGLRRYSRRIACVVAAVIVLIPGFMIPINANRAIADQVTTIGQPARWAPVPVLPGQNVAYLYSYGPDSTGDYGCEDHCQRLLFTGVAGRVLLGDVASLKSGSGLKQYWLARSTRQCPTERFTDAYADERDMGRSAPFPRPLLTNYLRIQSNGDKCLYEAPAMLSEADIVLAQWFRPVGKVETIWAGRFDPRLGAVDSQSGAAIYRVRAGKLQRIRKKTYASALLLRVPLALDAPGISFVSGAKVSGRWSRSGSIERGEEPEFGLSKFITNDLSIRGLK